MDYSLRSARIFFKADMTAEEEEDEQKRKEGEAGATGEGSGSGESGAPPHRQTKEDHLLHHRLMVRPYSNVSVNPLPVYGATCYSSR